MPAWISWLIDFDCQTGIHVMHDFRFDQYCLQMRNSFAHSILSHRTPLAHDFLRGIWTQRYHLRRAAMDSILTVLLLVLVLFGAMIGIGHLLWVGIATLLGYQVRTVSRSQSKSQQQHRQGQSVEETLNDLAVAGLIDKPTLFRVLEALKIHRARSLTPVELIATRATQQASPPPLPAIPVQPIAADFKAS